MKSDTLTESEPLSLDQRDGQGFAESDTLHGCLATLSVLSAVLRLGGWEGGHKC